MTREDAREKARRLAGITRQPAVVFRCPMEGWEVWHTLEAAKWLGVDGEVVMPERLADPEGTEGELRRQAGQLHGPARARLLEAAMQVRGELAVARIAERAMQ